MDALEEQKSTIQYGLAAALSYSDGTETIKLVRSDRSVARQPVRLITLCVVEYVAPTSKPTGQILHSVLCKERSITSISVMMKHTSPFNLSTCARPNILALQPYRCAREYFPQENLHHVYFDD